MIGSLRVLGGPGGRFRHSIERMVPEHYLSSPYYEHWLTGVTTMAVESGFATQDELDRRAGGHFPLSRADRGVLPDDLNLRTEPRYAVGDDVRVRAGTRRGIPARRATCRAGSARSYASTARSTSTTSRPTVADR
jgi:nitrile hydratase subunit beta